MRLYCSPGACSLAPHIVARETGLPIELVKVDLGAKLTQGGEDFLEINPKGSVPALVLINGIVLTEAAVVMQFLAEKSPGAGLLPPYGTFDRYRALEWLNFIATELHKTFGPLWRQDTPEETRAIVKTTLCSKFGILDRHLAGRDFLVDDRFGIADAYAFTILTWAPVVGIGLAGWPSLVGYVERIAARPAVREARAAEGLE